MTGSDVTSKAFINKLNTLKPKSMGNVFRFDKEFMDMDLSEVEKLLVNSDHYVRVGAVSIMDFQARSKKTTPEHRKALFDLYIKRHEKIDTWDLVDRSAIWVVGKYLEDKPRKILYKLAKSKMMAERRTAIVATAHFIRQNDLDDTIKIAEILLDDKEDLIHKAVGWMLRFAGDKDKKRLKDFLDKYAGTMPRVMLRYAIEKFMAMENSKTFKLNDGRTLGYVEYGNLEGTPLLYFHGHPGSRFEAKFLAEEATRAGVRLIGIDRPGMGLSTYKGGRKILDWPDDVVELVDSLHIDRFAVVGFSGGGPYALACAYKISNRLTACGIVSGVGHTGLFLSFLSMWLPWLMLPMTRRFFRDEEHAKNLLARASQRWVEPDRKALSSPGIDEIMSASLVEAVKQGTKGAAYDGTLIGSRNWGFNLEDITFPKLYLWHGELDTQIPVTSVQMLAKRLVTCRATYYPNEGHISSIVNHAADILKALL